MKSEDFNRLIARVSRRPAYYAIFELFEDLATLTVSQEKRLHALFKANEVTSIELNGEHTELFSEKTIEALFKLIKIGQVKTLTLCKIPLVQWTRSIWEAFGPQLKASCLTKLGFAFTHFGKIDPSYVSALFQSMPLSMVALRVEAEDFGNLTENAWKESLWDLWFEKLSSMPHVQSFTLAYGSGLGGTMSKFWSYGPRFTRTGLTHLGLESIGLEHIGDDDKSIEQLGMGSLPETFWEKTLKEEGHATKEEWLASYRLTMVPKEAWINFCAQLGPSIRSLSLRHNGFHCFRPQQWEWFFQGLAASAVIELDISWYAPLNMTKEVWTIFCIGFRKTNLTRFEYDEQQLTQEQQAAIKVMLLENVEKARRHQAASSAAHREPLAEVAVKTENKASSDSNEDSEQSRPAWSNSAVTTGAPAQQKTLSHTPHLSFSSGAPRKEQSASQSVETAAQVNPSALTHTTKGNPSLSTFR